MLPKWCVQVDNGDILSYNDKNMQTFKKHFPQLRNSIPLRQKSFKNNIVTNVPKGTDV